MVQAEADRRKLEGAEGIPEEWLEAKLGTAGVPDARFELLGDHGGFYQDPTAGGPEVAVTNLMHDLPSGTNVAHFRHLRDGRVGMCLACCALGLVRWPGVASAGTAGPGQSMTASINGQKPAYSIPAGASLLATLLLAGPRGDTTSGDAPVWDGADKRAPLGFLKGMTWQSRRVLLAPSDDDGARELPPGCCCHCGERTDRLVRSIYFRPGWPRPSKKPWEEDPHLLQVTRTDTPNARARARQIVPSWPSPNDPLEDHASVWRSVLKGLLQRSAKLPAGAARFHTTLLASSQQLYKHAVTHAAALPALRPEVAGLLLDELEWLRKVTWATTAGRGSTWRDPPKGHRVVEALCARGAKGHAIRSALCAISPLVQSELEEAFCELMRDLAATDPTDQSASDTASSNWRAQVRQILGHRIERAVGFATPGSPLRRRAARQRADDAVREAVRQIQSATQKKGAAK